MTQHLPVPLQQAWARFSSLLAEHAPADHAALRPPAPPEEITALEAEFGFPLHPELSALLRMHNGVSGVAGDFLPLRHRLSSTSEIGQMHRMLVGLGWHDDPDSPWDEDYLNGHPHQWVPFALPNDGGVAFVDHRPGPTYGQVYEMGIGSGASEATLWASSLGDLFIRLADALDGIAPFLYYQPQINAQTADGPLLSWDIVTSR
ncbi:SMI1/KNR4 family protein [Kitasatospora sp. NPDC004723]|uniref:SMI1/KNR4 family protein n=1 Tax=Kitasatospora sp. NPDC004723 TaxID=3154288 RepID=UPI0033A6898B